MTTATMPAPHATTAPTATMRRPLFAKPIPIIGVTGEFEAGKSRFLLSLCPGPDTLAFDTETSLTTYEDIGFRRVDVPAELLKLYPTGYAPQNTFSWWYSAVKAIPPGKFRVIALDVAEDIEAGLADWVWENPLHFKHTKNQYLKATGIFWGDVKTFWKSILLDISSRCEIFAFSVHLGSVWGSDNKPTGAKRPKGKSTLSELATLFLELTRPIQPDGSKQEVPSARVLKSRLSHNKVENGDLITKAILPPRLPECTPQAIRAYIAKPADFSKLAKGELDVPQQITDDERARMRLAIAEAEADRARLEIERMSEERKHGGNGSGNGYGHHDIDDAEHNGITDDAAAVHGTANLANGMAVAATTEEPTTLVSNDAAADSQGGQIVEAASSQPSQTLQEAIAAEAETRQQVDAALETSPKKRGRKKATPVTDLPGDFVPEPVPTPAAATPASTASTPTKATPTTATPTTATPTPSTDQPGTTLPYPLPEGSFKSILDCPPRDAVIQLWQEFCHLNGLPSGERDTQFSKLVLSKYNVKSIKELSYIQLTEIRNKLMAAVRKLFTDRGTPEACPF